MQRPQRLSQLPYLTQTMHRLIGKPLAQITIYYRRSSTGNIIFNIFCQRAQIKKWVRYASIRPIKKEECLGRDVAAVQVTMN